MSGLVSMCDVWVCMREREERERERENKGTQAREFISEGMKLNGTLKGIEVWCCKRCKVIVGVIAKKNEVSYEILVKVLRSSFFGSH